MSDDHKCVDPVFIPGDTTGFGFCCRCYWSGPRRVDKSEVEADCAEHQLVNCELDMSNWRPVSPEDMVRIRASLKATP